MPAPAIPDTNFDPIFEGKLIQFGIKDGIFTIEGEILSVKKQPQSDKATGKDRIGNINRKRWTGRHMRYVIECVIAQTLDDSALPAEGDHVTVDGFVCLADEGAQIDWSQDQETKVSLTVDYFPHMTLSTGS